MPMKRRRFLTIAASATLLPVAAEAQKARWTGSALGARSTMILAGMSTPEAAPVFAAVEAELVRLERIFSLYRPDSQISHLNAQGSLSNPAPELLEVLSFADGLHRATGGAFDPTVQPLWQAHAEAASAGRALTAGEIEELRSVIGWNKLDIGTERVTFRSRGMALTLNGVAQGYITDRIVAMLRGMGLRHAVVDIGEVFALGTRDMSSAWRAGIADPDGQILRRVSLTDRALATSAPKVYIVPGAAQGHILDPVTGRVARANLISISAPTALVADGLSTGLCLLRRGMISSVMRQYPAAKIEVLS